MTLKEKLDIIKGYDEQDPYATFMTIADDYAIEFSEWCTDPKNKLGYHSTKKEWFVWDLDKWVTTKELLEIFKKEKH